MLRSKYIHYPANDREDAMIMRSENNRTYHLLVILVAVVASLMVMALVMIARAQEVRYALVIALVGSYGESIATIPVNPKTGQGWTLPDCQVAGDMWLNHVDNSLGTEAEPGWSDGRRQPKFTCFPYTTSEAP